MKDTDKNIEVLISKYLTEVIEKEEQEKLEIWLEDNENRKVFDDYVRTDYLSSVATSKFDADRAKRDIFSRLERERKTRRITMISRIAVAASLVLIISLVAVLRFEKKDVVEPLVVAEDIIMPGSNKAVLTLESGENITLEKGKQYTSEYGKTNGEEIVYSAAKKEKVQEVKYNYLTVPRGGQFYLTLSDGTKIWLNSESRIKYPVHFLKDRPRSVELQYGEAFFDVSKAAKNNGRRFSVHTRNQNIEVLGTIFNIAAYKEEPSIATTLVEGKVKVVKDSKKAILVPGQQAVTSDSSKDIEVKKVDVNKVVAWKNGQFIFDDESLEDIMQVLSRWYDVEIVFENENSKRYLFTGILERYESIDNLLEIIKAANDGDINYRKLNKKIVIY